MRGLGEDPVAPLKLGVLPLSNDTAVKGAPGMNVVTLNDADALPTESTALVVEAGALADMTRTTTWSRLAAVPASAVKGPPFGLLSPPLTEIGTGEGYP